MAINLLIYLVSKDVFPFVGLAFIAENLLFDCYSIYMYFNITAFTLLIDFLELGIICYHAISKQILVRSISEAPFGKQVWAKIAI